MSIKRFVYYLGTRVIFRPKFIRDFYRFRSLQKDKNKIIWTDVLPVFSDNTSETNFDSHYVYHPAWAARIIQNINPSKHIDISSTLHFCTLLSAFIPTEFYDYRPAKLNLSNLVTGRVDLCKMHFIDNSIFSLSCMHTIEHIGLGRYGDPLDPKGDIKAAQELQRVLAVGGSLLMVVPVGKEKIFFNAHRVYGYGQIIEMFNKLSLVSFALIPDNAIKTGIVENADPSMVALQNYGCGCFWFKKLPDSKI